MPSREEMSYFLPVPSETLKAADHHHHISTSTTQDFISRDIENLVSEIKENLRLSSFKSRHQRRLVRPSPYSNPSRSLSECCESCMKNSDDFNHNNGAKKVCPHHCSRTTINLVKTNNSPDDPYEMLQDLLRDGGLIKEAVRRLQKGLSPKESYFYESDEESSRSPLHLCRNVEV